MVFGSDRSAIRPRGDALAVDPFPPPEGGRFLQAQTRRRAGRAPDYYYHYYV